MLKIYAYKNCDTCRKAIKWLKANDIPFEELAIRETPPAKAELKTMLAAYEGDMRRLFNTSGGDYKSMGMKDKLPALTESQAFELLSGNGNLVKRPFLLGNGVALVGFKEPEWVDALKS